MGYDSSYLFFFLFGSCFSLWDHGEYLSRNFVKFAFNLVQYRVNLSLVIHVNLWIVKRAIHDIIMRVMALNQLPIYVKTQRESPNLIESIMFSTRKRRRSSTIAPFNLFVALFANSFTRSGAMVTSIPV